MGCFASLKTAVMCESQHISTVKQDKQMNFHIFSSV
ncbi:hypothetical protein T4D_14926 [Trichinella pseudospiralis]|uniref:Uncharacterized protein n=1 Tax=Trichinella pseudospiralis TaxID=6337 RepID=A0A0V1F2X1_TRIPS|nr:hypothetical protein T4D_14926 [Trichinella pseudospiralis]